MLYNVNGKPELQSAVAEQLVHSLLLDHLSIVLFGGTGSTSEYKNSSLEFILKPVIKANY
jgi:hypothetical protein